MPVGCGDVEKIIKKRQTQDETPVYYVSIEDTFDIVKRAHVATGHGGRDKMTKELQVKYDSIQRDTIELFKSLCLECQKKRKRPMTKGVVVKPILSTQFLSHGLVDLINMQSMSCRTFKWIMVYQDHPTKFCVLRPLTSKRAAEVAFQLANIFLLLGAPVILQSDNGSEFTAQIINELRSLWPELSIVHGKPRHPQSQGSVERANGDIKDMLVAWMADNSTDWATGIKFVQFSKNSAYHVGIKRSPYAATRTRATIQASNEP
ncbi:KRAB-A domain-containing protein 2-like [Palaemon carinicauda]|uniref:KRAB-A domain-containing protein 2-like n=1 Tax=Palaemon carinicauda TaxID=392227 RepID=UPI0035B620FE